METEQVSIPLRERLAAVLSFIGAYIYVYDETPFGFSLIAVLLFLMAELLAAEKPFIKECAFFYVCTFLLAVSLDLYWEYPRFDSAVFSYDTRALFLHGMTVYAVLVRLGGLWEGTTGVYAPLDFVYGFFAYPFSNFFRRAKALFSGYRKKSLQDTAVSLLVVFAALLLLSAVFGLLKEAGARFETVFTLPDSFHIGDYVLYFFVSLPVGAYWFGLMSGAKSRRPAGERLKKLPIHAKGASAALWELLLGAFIALSAVYFILEAPGTAGLVSAFFKSGAGAQETCRQARAGFFALAKVIALAFSLLGLERLTLKESSRAVFIMKTVVLACCLLFALSALVTLGVYITLLGWTVKRASALWLILVLLSGTVLYERYLLAGKTSFRRLFFTAAGSCAVLSLVPVSLLA